MLKTKIFQNQKANFRMKNNSAIKNIPCIILAGGMGTRLSEETLNKPKPMVEIGGFPIIWHIMKNYSAYGVNKFYICGGYKHNFIKDFFLNYKKYNNDLTIDLSKTKIKYLNSKDDKWKVSIIDTGLKSMTGGRLLRLKEYLKNYEDFFFTYGDGLSNINISELFKFHKKNKKIATLTSVYPEGRFGRLKISNDFVTSFNEKKKGDLGRVNAGFFVLNKKIFKYLDNDLTIFEREPLEKLAIEKQLMAFSHNGFWQPMDNIRDMSYLVSLWDKGDPPWKIWQD